MLFLVFFDTSWNNKLVILILWRCRPIIIRRLVTNVGPIGRCPSRRMVGVIPLIHLVNRLVSRVIHNDDVLSNVLNCAMVDNLMIFLLLLLLSIWLPLR